MDIFTDMLGLQIEPFKRMRGRCVGENYRRELDILPALMSSPERSKFLNFTKPYLNFPFVIYTLSDSPFIAKLNVLNGKNVAVENGYASY